MMNIFSGLIGVVFAAETILSPMAEHVATKIENAANPNQTRAPVSALGKLLSFIPPTPTVLGPVTPSDGPSPLPQSILPNPTLPSQQSTNIRLAKKSTITVALLGDSMTDTLGPEALPLKETLKKVYPATTFIIKNFGVGGENIDSAINRITEPYTYLGVDHPSLSSVKPDLVVIESCGYNPYSFDEGAIDKHWLALAHAVNLIKGNVPDAKIIIGATIAPNASVFGDGAAGLSFSPQAKQEKITVIKKYLENTIRFAKGENLPLADAYSGSLMKDGNGNLKYINSGDHIHYSDAGRTFFSQKIANTIIENRLIE
jgi:hypothetical protein